MPVYPKVQRHCPYKSERAAAMDGDICRICDKQVIDMTAWTDAERIAFAANQKEEVCISYRLPVRPAIAAAALAAAMPGMAAAQSAPPSPPAAAQAPGSYCSLPPEIVGSCSRLRPDPAISAVAIVWEAQTAISMVTVEEALAAIPEAPIIERNGRRAARPASPARPKS